MVHRLPPALQVQELALAMREAVGVRGKQGFVFYNRHAVVSLTKNALLAPDE